MATFSVPTSGASIPHPAPGVTPPRTATDETPTSGGLASRITPPKRFQRTPPDLVRWLTKRCPACGPQGLCDVDRVFFRAITDEIRRRQAGAQEAEAA
jgi:hypothetical protein